MMSYEVGGGSRDGGIYSLRRNICSLPFRWARTNFSQYHLFQINRVSNLDHALKARPQAAVLLDALSEMGVTHVVGIPDNGSAALFKMLEKADGPSLLTVTREGEAFAVASGLWLGGKRPVVLIQGTGLLEGGDSLRGTAVRMGVPLLCLIGYRGYAKMIAHDINPHAQPPDREGLVRKEVDSVALLIEPTLTAWGIPYCLYHADEDVAHVQVAWERAHRESRSVAVLLAQPFA